MTQGLKRAFLVGLLSQALAFSTLFAILSGLPDNGPKLCLVFLLTALALGFFTYSGALAATQKRRQRLLLLGIVILLFGIAALWIAAAQLDIAPTSLLLAFAVLGLFLLRRMVQLVEDLAYIRRSLLDQYTADILLVIIAALLLVFLAKDSNWERPTVPLFVAFLLARMVALSLASQLNKESGLQKSWTEKWQKRLPFLLIGLALFGGWVVVSVGGNFLLWMLTPLFTGVGHVVQWLIEHLGFLVWIKIFINSLNDWFNRLLCLMGICGDNPMHAGSGGGSRIVSIGQGLSSWLWLKVLGGLAVVLVAWMLFAKLRKAQLPHFNHDGTEVRQFVHKPPQSNKARPKVSLASLTRMRRLYRKFLFAMHKRGYVRSPGETAMELAKRLGDPLLLSDAQELTALYMQERYGEQKIEAQQTRAEQLFQNLMGKK